MCVCAYENKKTSTKRHLLHTIKARSTDKS